MLIVVWQNSDGSLRLTHPAIACGENETEEAFCERIASHALAADPELANCRRLANVRGDAIPARRWRDAWRAGADGAIVVDLAAARSLRKIELTQAIQSELSTTRLRVVEAEEAGDVGAVATFRQKAMLLREIEQSLDGQLAGVSDLNLLSDWRPAALKR